MAELKAKFTKMVKTGEYDEKKYAKFVKNTENDYRRHWKSYCPQMEMTEGRIKSISDKYCRTYKEQFRIWVEGV